MLDLTFLGTFHFEHPAWLLGIPLALLLFVLHARSVDAERRWQHIIAPELLRHLMVRAGQARRVRPAHLTFVLLAVGALALSGPTWKREAPPFVEDKAALVIVLDASQSMQAIDVQPSRMVRAQQKVRDLLAAREGARSALIAYAGSAHIVLPLTDDRDVLEMYVDSIQPDLMPSKGKRPAKGLALAQDLLGEQHTSGSILFLTDGIPEEERGAFLAHAQTGGAPVLMLALGTDAGGPLRLPQGSFATDGSGQRIMSHLDRAGFDALEQSADVDVTYGTVDTGDVERVVSRAQRNLESAQAEDQSLRWKDAGLYLLMPLLLLCGLWFRRGWVVRWAMVFVLAFLVSPRAHAHDSSFSSLWWTQDQQGRRHYEAGEYVDAAEHFRDPVWKGVAWYAAREYEKAADQFARLDTAEAWFNLGNAQAHLERYEDALASYAAALERRPDDPDALTNQKIVRAARERQKKKEEEEPAEGGDTLGADEVVEADPNDKTKRPEVKETVEGARAMDESMAEIWMRQVQTTPADFLRRKFAIQESERPPLKARKEDDDAKGTKK